MNNILLTEMESLQYYDTLHHLAFCRKTHKPHFKTYIFLALVRIQLRYQAPCLNYGIFMYR